MNPQDPLHPFQFLRNPFFYFNADKAYSYIVINKIIFLNLFFRCQLVNASTRLLCHLTSNYPTYINMQTKLQPIPGGTHKYLIALTRLAFSEGIFYEQGIEEDVADAAHQMLESLVNPQEAEALSEAFSGVKSSK